MHVIRRILRKVEVVDVADVGDVQAARRDIRRDQHREFAVVEFLHEAQPLVLRHVAGDRLRIDAVGTQHVFETFRHALGVDEHHRLVRAVRAQQVQQQRELLFHRRVVDQLAHAVRRDLVRLDAHELRILHVLVGELEHALRQRRREQHRLAMLGRGQLAQDVADVDDEAEVEHAIGFIEHDGLDEAGVEHMLLVVIDDAARRADQDVHAVLELAALFFIVHAAEHHGHAELRVLAEQHRVLVDLDGQFAGRGDDQRADRGGAAGGLGRVVDQALEQGQQEGCGLAGARLGLACHVPPGQGDREGLGLDRGAAGESGVENALQHGWREGQGVEGEGGKVFIRHESSVAV